MEQALYSNFDEINLSALPQQSFNSNILKSLNGPLMISWDVTNRCNLKCLHCFNNSAEGSVHNFCDELSEDEAMEVVNQIIDLRPYTMCICGGETLLRKDLIKIISKLSQANIIVNMVTNGYFLDEKKANELCNAGVSFVQVSLDGLRAEDHDRFRNKQGSFEKALNALTLLKNAGVKTAASFVPNKFAINDFEEYVDFVFNAGCKHIRMMPLLPMGRGLKNFHELEPTKEEYFKFCVSIQKKRSQYSSRGMIIEWGDPLEHIYLALEYKRATPIQMEIRANGDLGVSIYLPIVVGNIRKATLRDYWDGGYNRIWDHDAVKKIAKKIRTLYDFKEMQLKTWTDHHFSIDILNL
ncbi:radical SAM protein [Paenibacillus terrae]